MIGRIGDSEPPPLVSDLPSLAKRAADAPLAVPQSFPATTPKSGQVRFTDSSIYPYLETNVSDVAMQFSQEDIPNQKSQRSIDRHGVETPFRHWHVIRDYLQSLVYRNNYNSLVSYNTTVEKVEKVSGEWVLTLRKSEEDHDSWWQESFDAVVVANGHFSVPYIPTIDGLEEFEASRPGSVLHSKQFRGKDDYKNKVSPHVPCTHLRVLY